jgi:hexokinase
MWRITNCDESVPVESQPSLAELLRSELRDRGIVTNGRIVFANDTAAVVLDAESAPHIPTLPVGFVFGTGVNAAVYSNTERGIINLETGRGTFVPPDNVTEIMEQRGWVPKNSAELEHWIGGAYLPKRVAGYVLANADELTDAEQVARKILTSDQQTLLSDIASGESPKNFGLHIGPSEYPTIRACVRTVMQQAGQLIGIHVAAVSSAIGYQHGKVIVPYEGSLYAKGHGIQQHAMQTVRMLLPDADMQLQHVSGMRGVAKLSLVLTHQRRTES